MRIWVTASPISCQRLRGAERGGESRDTKSWEGREQSCAAKCSSMTPMQAAIKASSPYGASTVIRY